jgi:hypothetical protein
MSLFTLQRSHPRNKICSIDSTTASVADPHRKNADADADPGKNLSADADPDADADSCPY